ncbi:MAG: PhzF family phenazine biosynthesis protein [Anaerolineae bacterium]
MEVLLYVVRAFCRKGKGGNLAGVVIIDESLSSFQMQSLAAALKFSETVFLSKRIDGGGYKALYFTPNAPIDFCGHASIAAFEVLRQLKSLVEGLYLLETPAGLCEITIAKSLIYVSQSLPRFEEEVLEEEIAAVLGVSAEEIRETHLRPQVVSTGLRDIIVPVMSRECLFAIEPKYDEITRLSEKYDVVGLHVFSLASLNSSGSAHCRNFAPRYGIPEESATGSSNGALACYLFHNRVFLSNPEKTLLFKQGDTLKMPSDIHVRLNIRENKIMRVECGGEVVIEDRKKVVLQE